MRRGHSAKNDLHDSAPVAEVYKDQLTVVAPRMNPARKLHFLSLAAHNIYDVRFFHGFYDE